MMDSQEMALNQGMVEDQNLNEQAAKPVEEEVENNAAEQQPASQEQQQRTYASKNEVLERVKEIAHGEEPPQKDEVDYLKTTFYKLHHAEREAAFQAYIDGGGNAETYQVMPDECEEAFKAEMGIIRERRAAIFQEQEKEKEANLKRKLEIIERIKAMSTSPDEVNKCYQEFKQLRQEWNEIKAVPAERASELWRSYQHNVEQFYDLLKLNSEAREYDFKKNLEIKTRICEAAERLAEEEDVISAFHQLQELHQQYRETGPVARDIREEIWTRFKNASTVVNKRHQQHFEDLRGREEENLQKKTALCERVEAIGKEENKGAADWENHTKEIIALQAEWKTIGFAPQKMNVKIFERFRAACDDFFSRKTEYFKQMKEQFAANAEKKRALVEQAQALQDSTDWKSTSDKLIALQKEWKTIGMVPRKLGDQLWNDFLAASNKFFEARNEANAGTRNEEKENLARKRDIIEQLKAIAEEKIENAKEKVHELTEQYHAIGHVPYRDKDKVYAAYKEVLDKIYKELNISTARRRLDSFKSTMRDMAKKGENAIDNERGRLMRRYESLKQEIQTYDNNIGFLTAASKKGNTLIDEMTRKIEKLRDEMNLVREKIKTIDRGNFEEEEKPEATAEPTVAAEEPVVETPVEETQEEKPEAEQAETTAEE